LNEAFHEEEIKNSLMRVGLATDDELNKSKIRRNAVEAEHSAALFGNIGAPVWFTRGINQLQDRLFAFLFFVLLQRW
jgi:hypothetical protein